MLLLSCAAGRQDEQCNKSERLEVSKHTTPPSCEADAGSLGRNSHVIVRTALTRLACKQLLGHFGCDADFA